MEDKMEWIDRKIREKIQDLELFPKAEIWNNIEHAQKFQTKALAKHYAFLYSISVISILISSLIYFDNFNNSPDTYENKQLISTQNNSKDSSTSSMSIQNPFASYHHPGKNNKRKGNIRNIQTEKNPALKNPLQASKNIIVPDGAIQQDIHPEEIKNIENQMYVIQKKATKTEIKKNPEEEDNNSFAGHSDKELTSQNSHQEEALLWEEYCSGINNFISPNADGINDYWVISLPDIYKPIKVVIFNSKGFKVFSSSDYNNDFDGIFQGQILAEGTYYYILESRNKRICKGALNILK
jgi:gliding motility-associated-like protein